MLHSLAAYRRLRPAALPLAAAVRCVSSGSVHITVPLNFWAGKRQTIQEKRNKENVYEPATGKPQTLMLTFDKSQILLTQIMQWTLIPVLNACVLGGFWLENTHVSLSSRKTSIQ